MSVKIIGTVVQYDSEANLFPAFVETNAEMERADLSLLAVVPPDGSQTVFPTFSRRFGGELRTEIKATAKRLDRVVTADVRVSLFEGTTTSTTDLEGTSRFQLAANERYGGLGRTRIRNAEGGGSDFADVALMLLPDAPQPAAGVVLAVPARRVVRLVGEVMISRVSKPPTRLAVTSLLALSFGLTSTASLTLRRADSGESVRFVMRGELLRSGWAACLVDATLHDEDPVLVGVEPLMYLVPPAASSRRRVRIQSTVPTWQNVVADVDLSVINSN